MFQLWSTFCRVLQFFQGKNSKKEKIIRKKLLEHKIDGLKLWCSENPDCKGFNTDAYMKHTINSPLTTKSLWANEPTKGIYIKQLPDDTIYSAEFVDYNSEEAQNIRTQMKNTVSLLEEGGIEGFDTSYTDDSFENNDGINDN